MMQGVYVDHYPAPPFREKEALRYAGYLGRAGDNGELFALFQTCEREFSYRVCHCVLSVEKCISVFGEDCKAWLLPRLHGANQVAIFCATVGLGIDRLIRRYSAVSPTKALLLQALGTERVESLCDAFCDSLQPNAGKRFSAGYGNIPLQVQSTICSLLDCSRKIGVSLSDRLLMTPSKSVTAFVPLKE